MGDLLAWGAKKIALSALGLIGALVWWSMGGGGDYQYEQLERMPAAVFDGGAGTLSIEVKTSQPAELHASFSQWDEADEDESALAVDEALSAGLHTRSVDVAPDTYVYFEVGVPEAEVGATLEWTVFLDGQEILSERERLDEPLRDGWAFFVQLEADRIEEIRSWAQ